MGTVLPARQRPGLTGAALAYVLVSGAAGLALCLLAASRLDIADVLEMGSPFALIAGLLLIGELRPVVASGSYDPQGVNISTAFVFAILVYWGPWPAVLLQGAAIVLGEAARRKQLWRLVFNFGQYVVCLALAALVLEAFGLTGTPTHPFWIEAQHLPALALSWVVYFVANTLLVGCALALYQRSRVIDEVLDELGYYAVTMFAVLALSPVVVVVTMTSWQMIPLLLLPLFLVYKTASISLEKEHAALHDALTGAGQPQAALHPQHCGDVDRLLQLADIAMYQAKEGRTGVEVYSPDRDVHTTARLELIGSVRRAVESW